MKKRDAPRRRGAEPEREAIGLEAEFVCFVDDVAADPQEVFGDPRNFLGADAMHRVGTSYHLPTGGAVYFDTGVMELVTPIIDLDRGAPSQAVRSLWEGVRAVREGLDDWSDRTGRGTRLVGFSAHYNVSLPVLGDGGRVASMAWLLVHMLPFPVILFAANRRSTGVGVRPRPGRLEVTVDFTPDPALMAATTAIIAAAVQEVAGWSSHDLKELTRRGYPRLRSLDPIPHTSRKGWLVRAHCLDGDPFRMSPDVARWRIHGGETISLREAVQRTASLLEPRIRRIAEPGMMGFIGRVLARRHPSLLDLEDRPAAYEDVGRMALWRERDPARPLPRSLYERVMLDATRGVPLVTGGRRWLPIATRGWTRVLYQRDDGRRQVFSVDDLVRLRRDG